jgi:branched-chain amino acid transport system substrate-binding protein
MSIQSSIAALERLARRLRTARRLRGGNGPCGQLGLALAFAISASSNVAGQEAVKIGFLSTFTGPNAILGRELRDGFNLAIKLEGGKLGGVPVQVVIADDQQQPDLGRQAVEKLIERDRAQVITGVAFGNVMLAVARPIVDNDAFFIGVNAGNREFAGSQCNKNFFFASWQTENAPEAIGQYAQQNGYKRVYLMAPDYTSGKEMIEGFKRFYKGQIAGEVYTPLSQMDFAAELAKVRETKPDALYIFYPGGLGVNFLKQFAAAGLSGVIPLLGPSYSFDQTILPAVADAAVGAKYGTFWGEDLDNKANKEFVAAYRAEYGRSPSPYSAQAYDGARLIASALKATGGNVRDKERFRAALHQASFESVRGPFSFNRNNFPIQDWYWGEIVKDQEGKPAMQIRGKVFTKHQDAYVDNCKMKSN